MYSIRKYECLDGRIPFDDWIRTFKNRKDKARLLKRLDKIQLGNLGDWASVGDSIFELREHFGKGYRIYHAIEKQTIILLLCAGGKSSQVKNIKLAKQYWQNFQEGL